MAEQHPIQDIMRTTMENIKDMIDVNTIVGDAVETSEGKVIIPISRVSFGFVSGGGDYNITSNRGKETSANADTAEGSKLPFAGGTGAGVTVQPVAFLVVGKEQVRLLPVLYNNVVDRLVDAVPQLLNEVKGFMKNDEEGIE
ncbi:MAG: hypothetical protein PWQ93_924 [Clostridiales bacterium]|nr:hypothetical protein [Clostridiales bacterium]